MYRSERLNRVIIQPLIVHSDGRGYLFEVLRNDDPAFKEFGQAYINYTEPGVIKGFHSHRFNEDNFVCLSGRIKLVLLDPDTKEVMEIFLGPENCRRVTIPVELMHGWMALGNERACVLNVSTKSYNPKDPDETRVPPDFYSWYDWKVKFH